jgi:hypothetical protein
VAPKRTMEPNGTSAWRRSDQCFRLGHKRTYAVQQAMSALLLMTTEKADIGFYAFPCLTLRLTKAS